MHKGYNQTLLNFSLLLVFYFCYGVEYTHRINAQFGSSIRLPCYADGTRLVYSVQLFKDGSLVLAYLNGRITAHSNKVSLNTTNYFVKLSDVQIDDAGMYLCISDSLVDFRTETFCISVYVLPTEVIVSAPLSRIPANDSQFVTCAVARVYPADSLTFYVMTANNTITNLSHVDYDVHDDDTFSAEASGVVTFVPKYNVHKVHCRVDYNGAGSDYSQLTSELELVVESKPGKPHSLQLESRSYREIVFSFIPGQSNGYAQTLTILIKLHSEDVYTELNHDIYDPRPDARYEVTVCDVIHKTTMYTIQVRADNEYICGEPSFSEPFTVTTRDELYLKTEMLLIKRNTNEVILSWMEPEGDYTSLAIERCIMGENCVTYDVSLVNEIALPAVAGANFTFIVYQDRDIVARGIFLPNSVKDENHKSGASDNRSAACVIAGAVVSVIVMFIIDDITCGIVCKKGETRQLNQDILHILPETQPDSAARKTCIAYSAKQMAQDSEFPYKDVWDNENVSSMSQDHFNLNELAMKTKIWQ